MVEDVGKILDKGFSILFFPEGKVSTTGKLQEIKKGAGLLATEMNISIVPISISGIQEILPAYKILPKKRGIVHVRFGKEIKIKPGTSHIEATEIIEKALKELANL